MEREGDDRGTVSAIFTPTGDRVPRAIRGKIAPFGPAYRYQPEVLVTVDGKVTY